MVGKKPRCVYQNSKGGKWRRDKKGDNAMKKKIREGVMAQIRKTYGLKH